MKTTTLLIFIVMLLFLFQHASCDRGVLLLDTNVSVQEPVQLAVVAWNGKQEALAIAVQITSDKKTKLIEILPLPSKPIKIKEVTPSLFLELERAAREYMPIEKKVERSRAVQLVEKIQLGVHDIAVIRAANAPVLMEWLVQYAARNNATLPRVSPKLMSAIENYTNAGFTYWIVDMVNIQTEDVAIKPVLYIFDSKYLYYPMRITAAGDAGNSYTSVRLFLLCDKKLEIDTLPSEFSSVAGFDSNIALSRKFVATLEPEIAKMFNENIFLHVVEYKGNVTNAPDLMVHASKLYVPPVAQLELLQKELAEKQMLLEAMKRDITLLRMAVAFEFFIIILLILFLPRRE